MFYKKIILFYHFIYYEGNDNLFNFINWGKLNADEVIFRKDLVDRITFSLLHEIEVRKLRQKQIKNSNKLINKKNCLKTNSEVIAEGYEILAYIYSKLNKIKYIYYYLCSLFSKFRIKTFLSFIRKLITGKYGKKGSPKFNSVQIRNDNYVNENLNKNKLILKTLS